MYLMWHLRVHTSEKSYKCDNCLTFYARKNDLSSHKEIHLPKELRFKFNCLKYPEKFKTQRGLGGHNVVRHNDGNISELSLSLIHI